MAITTLENNWLMSPPCNTFQISMNMRVRIISNNTNLVTLNLSRKVFIRSQLGNKSDFNISSTVVYSRFFKYNFNLKNKKVWFFIYWLYLGLLKIFGTFFLKNLHLKFFDYNAGENERINLSFLRQFQGFCLGESHWVLCSWKVI